MKIAGYVALFALIQLASLALSIIGVPICAVLSAFDCVEVVRSPITQKVIGVWPKLFWLWSNDEDGVDPPGYGTRWKMFVWTALRNSVNNLRFVPGVSHAGRPLFYRTWTMHGKDFYVKVGWMSDGYPACSAGAGRGY